jgi:hypothetical protein
LKPIIVTRVAHAGSDDHRFMGVGALSELLGTETETGLLALAILGRRVSPVEKDALDAMAVSLTAADPRIWPLKASRIGASYGEVLVGLAVGQLAMMGTYTGPRIIGAAAEHLARLRRALGVDTAERIVAARIAEHMTTQERFAGYGIPMREHDERFLALRGYMERTRRDRLPHWQAQEALSAAMVRERKLAPNIGIGLAAGLLDLGATPAQAGALAIGLIQHDFAANAFEAAQQRSSAMQQLPEDCVDYVGPPPRSSPRSGR